MSYCDVDFDDASDDADPVEMYDEKVVTSRAPHQCIECRDPIAAGETCLRKSYRFEGAFHTEHVCDACREVAGEFQHRFIGGLLWQSFWEEWASGAKVQGCLNRLTSVRAKTTMREQWQRWHDKDAERERRRLRELREEQSKHVE